MKYVRIRSYEMSEAQLRKTWSDTYCDRANPIYTFDGILVQFYSEMFDHAFYESANRKMKDKSVLSLNRCEKIHWIKDALQDPDSVLKKGWDTKTKSYDGNRRVAVVKGNYVVVINIISEAVARFITAYQIDDDENLNKLLSGPDYDRAKK